MPDIDETALNKVVEHYIRGNDKQTARNYIKTWGPLIKDYDINLALQELDHPNLLKEDSSKKEIKTKKTEKEDEPKKESFNKTDF